MSGNCNQSFSQSQKWCNVLGLSKRTLQACSNLNGVKSNAKVLRCATTALATRWKHISCSSHFEGPQICSKGLQKCAATVVRAAACSFLLLAMWTSFNEASHGKHDALWVLMVIPSWEASSQKKMYACSALAILCRIYIYMYTCIYIYLFIYLFIYLCILYTICIYTYIYIYYIICANSCGRYQEVPSDVSTGISYSADCLLVCICGQRFGIVRGKWIGILRVSIRLYSSRFSTAPLYGTCAIS